MDDDQDLQSTPQEEESEEIMDWPTFLQKFTRIWVIPILLLLVLSSAAAACPVFIPPEHP